MFLLVGVGITQQLLLTIVGEKGTLLIPTTATRNWHGIGGDGDSKLGTSFHHQHHPLVSTMVTETSSSFLRKNQIRGEWNGTLSNLSIISLNDNGSNNEERTLLPTWMVQYFAWHRQQMNTIHPTNWNQSEQHPQHQYLIIRCLKVDQFCGGASDRLQMIPMAIRLAAQYKRILLIRWELPHPLEEFLQPTHHWNWTVPSWMLERIQFRSKADIVHDNHFRHFMNHSKTVLTMRYQSHSQGADYYNQHLLAGEADFDGVYRACWHATFQPAEPIQALIQQSLHSDLRRLLRDDTRYVGVHIRSKYHRYRSNRTRVIANAINCARQLASDLPIYVAADDQRVLELSHEYGQFVNGTIVTRSALAQPLHLDRGEQFYTIRQKKHAEDKEEKEEDALEREPLNKLIPADHYPVERYYDIFVDLYLLASAGCIVTHKGGYGRWAARISGTTCTLWNHENHHCQTWPIPIGARAVG